MAYLTLLLAGYLLAMSMETTALPQASITTVADLTSPTVSSGVTPTASSDAVALPTAILESLPIIEVEGDDSSTIVQSSNSSLLDAHPELDVEPTHDLDQLASNLTRRDQCVGGPFASPLTPWTNVKLLVDRVCDFWFPNNQVFYVPAPLPAPGFNLVKIPFGSSLPTLNVKYQTINPAPATDLFTPLTSTICKKRFDNILAFGIATGNFQCPAPPNVHAGNDCDVTTRAACFSFYLT